MKISDEIRNDFLRNDDVGEVAYRQLLCIADRIDRKMVELPKDADGREIPLDTKVLYDIDGGKHEVNFYSFAPESGYWAVNIDMQSDSETHVTEGFHLTRPDSFERIADELEGLSVDSMISDINLTSACALDLAKRIRELAKIGGTR